MSSGYWYRKRTVAGRRFRFSRRQSAVRGRQHRSQRDRPRPVKVSPPSFLAFSHHHHIRLSAASSYSIPCSLFGRARRSLAAELADSRTQATLHPQSAMQPAPPPPPTARFLPPPAGGGQHGRLLAQVMRGAQHHLPVLAGGARAAAVLPTPVQQRRRRRVPEHLPRQPLLPRCGPQPPARHRLPAADGERLAPLAGRDVCLQPSQQGAALPREVHGVPAAGLGRGFAACLATTAPSSG